MQHATVSTKAKWHNGRFLPTPQSKLLGVLSVLIGFATVATFVTIWIAPAVNLNNFFSASPALPGNAPSSNVINPNDDLAFKRITRNLADTNSPEAFQTLLHLRSGESLARRSLVLTALKNASPAVVPVLMTALNDSDPSVRAGAAQVLGMRRESQALWALTDATRDPDASVRLQAVTSLGLLGAWEMLPRLEQLSVNETGYAVRQAAIAAKESFKKEIAQSIGVFVSELRDISVTSGEVPQIFAVTTSNLYALDRNSSWTLVSRLPDAPLALASGADPKLLYLATVSSGLYQSFDAGETWKHVQFGLQTPTRLTVTAIAVDPLNSRQVYIALASSGLGQGAKDSLGISWSQDGGDTWWALVNAPTNMVITRLVLDSQERGYLFGMTSDTPWRYTLPAQSCDYCLNRAR